MEGFSEAAKQLFQGELLQTAWTTDKEGKLVLLTGMGEPGLEVIRLKELGAAAVKECRAKKITDFSMNIEEVLKGVWRGCCTPYYRRCCSWHI